MIRRRLSNGNGKLRGNVNLRRSGRQVRTVIEVDPVPAGRGEANLGFRALLKEGACKHYGAAFGHGRDVGKVERGAVQRDRKPAEARGDLRSLNGDGDGLPGLRGAPDPDLFVTLQDHVVLEH